MSMTSSKESEPSKNSSSTEFIMILSDNEAVPSSKEKIFLYK